LSTEDEGRRRLSEDYFETLIATFEAVIPTVGALFGAPVMSYSVIGGAGGVAVSPVTVVVPGFEEVVPIPVPEGESQPRI